MTTTNEAKERAKQAAAAAWTAQPVRQADGTMLELCWHGRIARAYKLLVSAADGEQKQKLQAGIDKLAAMADAANNAAEQAISDYCALALANGEQPEDLYPLACTCAGCKEAGAAHRIGSSVGNLRSVVWDFMGDDGDGAPELVTLFRKYREDEKVRDLFWRRVLGVVDAMQDYMDACAQNGQRPNWRELWS